MLPPVNTNTSKTRILVVEDEGIIARDIMTMLQQLEYEVAGQAGNGADALALAKTSSIDLVLMDIKIRGSKDGVETAEEIRSTVGIPVVFLTAHADAETLKRANNTQPFGYIVKPFSASDLKVAIEVGLNRYRLWRQAENSRIRSHSAMELISEAVFAADSEGTVTFLNSAAERLTGWNFSEARGRILQEILRLTVPAQINLLDLHRYRFDSQPISFANATLLRRDGVESFVEGSFGPIRKMGSQEMPGFIAALRPMAKLQDPSLPSSDKQLQELSYALSNDLREPVRNISCFAALLERRGAASLDDSSREYLDFIVTGSKRVEDQMSALRSFHLAGSVAPPSGLSADATAICNEVLDDLRTSLEEAHAQIEIGPLPAVAMSPIAFKEVVRHLILNAIRFRAERTLQIRISAMSTGGFWKFTFEDNGLGFDAGQSERIFSLFTKAHELQRSGNGLGLAICKRSIEAVGGRIWAESQKGQGSQFHFTVPALSLRDAAA